MFNEYEAGRTPNPDVLCNREVKFDIFLDFAQESWSETMSPLDITAEKESRRMQRERPLLNSSQARITTKTRAIFSAKSIKSN